jgi:hypothetical protein
MLWTTLLTTLTLYQPVYREYLKAYGPFLQHIVVVSLYATKQHFTLLKFFLLLRRLRACLIHMASYLLGLKINQIS